MSKFKIGDKVVRIGDSYPQYGVVNGNIYIVRGVHKDDGEYSLTLEGILDKYWSIENFELYQEPLYTVYADPVLEQQRIVVEWLGKLAHVLASDYTVNEIYRIGNGTEACMEIFSDCENITGNQNVAEFINNRYSQLMEQANKAKRESLLADIVKAKEAYEALVGELAELEKGL